MTAGLDKVPDKLRTKFGQPPFQDLAPGCKQPSQALGCKQPSPDNGLSQQYIGIHYTGILSQIHNYLARARMSPLPDPVEAVEGSRVRACTENLVDRFSRSSQGSLNQCLFQYTEPDI